MDSASVDPVNLLFYYNFMLTAFNIRLKFIRFNGYIDFHIIHLYVSLTYKWAMRRAPVIWWYTLYYLIDDV